MIAFGVWLRIQHVGFPSNFGFDEHHFVPNARNYLHGVSDTNDHPPLGKLLIALAIRLFGDQSVAWRLPALALGIATIALGGWLAEWAFRDRRAGWIAAALVAIDGFFISYSRAALLDGTLTAFCLLGMVLLVRSHTRWGRAIAALVVGSACAIKFSGIVFLPALVAIAAIRDNKKYALVLLTLAVAAYFGWFAFGLSLSHRPSGIRAVAAETWRLYQHHAHLTEWKNALCTHWYEWFTPKRPILLQWHGAEDGRIRAASSLGNLGLWWAVDVVIVVTVARGLAFLARAARRWFRIDWREVYDSASGRQWVLAMLWLLPVVPWIVSKRDSYMYHYLPAYVFGVTLVGGTIARLYAKWRFVGLLTLLVLSEISVYYAPVWAERPISRAGFERRLFVESWR